MDSSGDSVGEETNPSLRARPAIFYHHGAQEIYATIFPGVRGRETVRGKRRHLLLESDAVTTPAMDAFSKRAANCGAILQNPKLVFQKSSCMLNTNVPIDAVIMLN